ncbi:MAG: lytic transglycosylase domain-containing protein [Verrucomicrobia bacterium]|nr:MAG: lytic transglycosylase domain-containing protein [Verrucomicrobiota bacterium]
MVQQQWQSRAGLILACVLSGSVTAWAGLAASHSGDLYELDLDLINRLGQGTIVDQVDLPSAADWQEFWTFIEDALHTESVDDLAAVYPGVQRALSYLQSMPDAKPYAAWLRQRQDYFDMARQVQLLYPAKPLGPSPNAPPLGKIRLAPPRVPTLDLPAQLIQKRGVYLRSQETWTKKLRGRLKPEEAAFLIPQLKNTFESEGVPGEWVWLAEVESSLNPQARSPVGAAGLFQFMPATAKRYGLSLTPRDERLDPAKSARAAAKCLRALHGQFGSWPLTLAAYNAGDGRVARMVGKDQAKTFDQIADNLPVETQMYVPKVCATIKLREGVEAAALPPPKTSVARAP